MRNNGESKTLAERGRSRPFTFFVPLMRINIFVKDVDNSIHAQISWTRTILVKTPHDVFLCAIVT